MSRCDTRFGGVDWKCSASRHALSRARFAAVGLDRPRSQSVRLGKRRRSAPTLGQGQKEDLSKTEALDK